MKLVGNYHYQRAANSALVLNYLMRHGDTPRSVIAHGVDLAPSTVTYIVQRLIDVGLVQERDGVEEAVGRGRRGVKIGVNGDAGRVIGCDLQADYYTAVVTDITGRVITRIHRAYRARSTDFASLLARVVGEVAEAVGGDYPIYGAGVALPGTVAVEEAVIAECWTHGVYNKDLSPFLRERFPFPVIIENDANACAWKVLWYDRARGSSETFLYLLPRFHRREMLPLGAPSVGIGMGLVFGGRVHRGVTNRAGEFVSNGWITGGRPRRPGPGQLGLSDEIQDRLSTSPHARRELVAEVLGSLSQFIFMTDPSAVYIGGDLSGEQAMIDEVVDGEAAWPWRSFRRNGGRITALDNAVFDPAEGAIACVLDRLYAVPRVGKEARARTLLDHAVAAHGSNAAQPAAVQRGRGDG